MIIRDIELLNASIKDKAIKAISEMNADSKLKQLGASGVVVIETIRQLVTQMAYYARGRMDTDDVRSMFYAAKLWELSDMEAKQKVTWTLKSKHIDGQAIDIAPIRNGRVWWGAPDAVWQRMGEIGKLNGLAWGGDWKNKDTPHFEV
jgi:peptidoglycan LD-endopeptidase CwlK